MKDLKIYAYTDKCPAALEEYRQEHDLIFIQLDLNIFALPNVGDSINFDSDIIINNQYLKKMLYEEHPCKDFEAFRDAYLLDSQIVTHRNFDCDNVFLHICPKIWL